MPIKDNPTTTPTPTKAEVDAANAAKKADAARDTVRDTTRAVDAPPVDPHTPQPEPFGSAGHALTADERAAADLAAHDPLNPLLVHDHAVTAAEQAVIDAQVKLNEAVAAHEEARAKAEVEAAKHAIPVKFRVGRDDLVDGTIPNADSDDVTVPGYPVFQNAQRRAVDSAIAPGEFFVVPEARTKAQLAQAAAQVRSDPANPSRRVPATTPPPPPKPHLEGK